jgi:heat shock protein HtpX
MTTFVNNTKTVLLLGALTALLVVVGAALGREFILPFLIMGIVMNLGAWFFSDKIAIATMRGQQVDENHPLYRMVDRLRRNANLPMPKVYICPHQAPNAFATGRSPSHAAVAATQGALQLLNEEELEGVMAHELAHVKNRDTLISTVAAIIAGVLAFIAQWGWLMGAGRGREGANIFVMLATIILAPIAAALIKAAISRSREFVADAEGARIAGTPRGLMSALHKLEVYAGRIPLDQPNPAMNNMFIIEPAMSMRGMSNLFATHPPTEKRIEALARIG